MDNLSFRIYITDALQAIAENTAIPAAGFSDGKAGKAMSRRWISKDAPPPPEETRTPEEIIEYMKQRCREVR